MIGTSGRIEDAGGNMATLKPHAWRQGNLRSALPVIVACL
jgi:hypothetical protein